MEDGWALAEGSSVVMDDFGASTSLIGELRSAGRVWVKNLRLARLGTSTLPLRIEIKVFRGLLRRSLGRCPCLRLSRNQCLVSQRLALRYIDTWEEGLCRKQASFRITQTCKSVALYCQHRRQSAFTCKLDRCGWVSPKSWENPASADANPAKSKDAGG